MTTHLHIHIHALTPSSTNIAPQVLTDLISAVLSGFHIHIETCEVTRLKGRAGEMQGSTQA